MFITRNYHTHTYLCNHAIGNVDDYILKACEYGYTEIGMSCHAPQVLSYFSQEDIDYLHIFQNMTIDEFHNIYLKDINEAKKIFDISIKSGLEIEYIDDLIYHISALKEEVDYLILGQHFYKHNGKIISSYAYLSDDEILSYATTLCEGLDSGLFKIVAHPDLFLLHQDNFNEACVKASKMIIESCIKNNVYLEINCNGKGVNTYPFEDFFKIVSTYQDILLIVGVDAHDPLRLKGEHIDLVEDFIKKLGLNVCDKIEF